VPPPFAIARLTPHALARWRRCRRTRRLGRLLSARWGRRQVKGLPGVAVLRAWSGKKSIGLRTAAVPWDLRALDADGGAGCAGTAEAVAAAAAVRVVVGRSRVGLPPSPPQAEPAPHVGGRTARVAQKGENSALDPPNPPSPLTSWSSPPRISPLPAPDPRPSEPGQRPRPRSPARAHCDRDQEHHGERRAPVCPRRGPRRGRGLGRGLGRRHVAPPPPGPPCHRV